MIFKKFAVSCLGYKHQISALMCQDFSDALEFDGVQIIAVADGHGSADCFRSHIGAEFAVKIFFEQAKLACENVTEKFSDTGINNFKFALYNEWRKAVRQDWFHKLATAKEFGDGEIRYKDVSEKYKNRYTSTDAGVLEKYLYAAYGTTLIAAISIGTQILILQIGDGTCVILRRDGEFCVPVPPDENNFLNVTTSFCEVDANLKMRHVVLDCDEKNPVAPVAIFLSTDGVDDCFPYNQNERHLYKFYAGVLVENMLAKGYDDTQKEIVESLLPGMTQKASRDDISLAYFVPEDIEILRAAYENISAEYKNEVAEEVAPVDDSATKIAGSVDLS